MCNNREELVTLIYLIYKSKHGVHPSICLFVWTKIGQCLEDYSSHCPFPVELVTNKAGAGQGMVGQGGQGGRCGGSREVPFLLKKSFGKTKGPASNQTKIHFFFKKNFIIEHIKKTRIFLKKKKEKRKKINKYIKIEKNEDRKNKNRKNKNMKQT
jgi:hypothetical protein